MDTSRYIGATNTFFEERKEFEKQFEDDLKLYSEATIKEITELYGK